MKILGLLAATAAAMMAFAANASATTVTSNGASYTGSFHASSEGHVDFHVAPSKILCPSTFTGTIETHSAAGTAHGPVSSLSFFNCTGGWTVTVEKAGRLEFHTDPNDPTGTSGNSTLTSSGATITAFNHPLGISCRYKTENTHIGTLRGSNTTGGHATLDIVASVPFHAGSPFCGPGAAVWTGSYTFDAPSNLNID
jgi:hypothetical protein